MKIVRARDVDARRRRKDMMWGEALAGETRLCAVCISSRQSSVVRRVLSIEAGR